MLNDLNEGGISQYLLYTSLKYMGYLNVLLHLQGLMTFSLVRLVAFLGA